MPIFYSIDVGKNNKERERERGRERKEKKFEWSGKKNRTIDVGWIVKWVINIYKVIFWVVKSKKF